MKPENGKSSPAGGKALLLLNGTPPEPDTLKRFWAAFNHKTAADGAANRLAELGLKPDAIAGDMDSLSSRAEAAFADVPRRRLHDQNHTDGEKAIRLLFDEGATEVHAIGYGGKRLDHEIHNLQLLLRFNLAGKKTVLWNESEKISMRNGNIEFRGGKGRRLSFFCLSGKAWIRSSEGLEYNLKNAVFSFGGPASVSNRILAERARISLASGWLCCVEEYSPEEFPLLL